MNVTKTYWENLKAYTDGYRIIVNKGSSRSGKTYGLVQVSDRILARSPIRRKMSIVSQSYNHLEQGVLEEYAKYQYNEKITRPKGKNTYRINQSLLNYFSLGDDPGKAVGPGRNILWLNEPNRGITYESFFQLRKRTNECIFIDYNPSGQFWLHTEGIMQDPRTKVIHSTWRDNIKNLTKADIEDFLDMYRRSKYSQMALYHWKVYGLGEDALLTEERIMPMLHRVSRVPDDAVEIPGWLDYGWNPDPISYGRLFMRKGPGGFEELYIKQEVYQTNLSINSKAESANNLTDILLTKGINPEHLIIAESADPRNNNDMQAAGFNVIAVTKQKVELSIRQFHKYKIFIVDGSEETFTEFDNYKFSRDKATNKITGIPEENQPNHSIDGIRYVLLSRNFWWAFP